MKKIIFKRKNFTIQEGHYTGPKDMDKTPGALEVVGKSALGGAVIGGISGKFLPNSTVMDGALTGAKTGTIAGIVLKFFLNYLHNPMNKIKYSEVDKNIRREFGIYRMAGITIGDNINKRDKLEDKFSFNDRNVCNYKLNFVIADNKITMYTFGMSDQELVKTSNILDYFCKTYVGMDYTSFLLNRKLNSYAVDITFTNYQVISNFIMELSQKLEVKINLLNNKAIIDRRFREKTEELENEVEKVDLENPEENQKTFSFLGLGKYDLIRILGKGGPLLLKGKGHAIMSILSETLHKMSISEKSKIPGASMAMDEMRNDYLKEALKRLHYINGINYSIGDAESEINMSLIRGIFIVTVNKNSKVAKWLENNYYKKFATKLKKINTNDVIVYSYAVQSKQELDLMLKCLMKCDERINIFDK